MHERWTKKIVFYLSFVTRVINWIALVIILSLMMVLITADVCLRYVFNSPLGWGHEVNALMLVAVVFFGLAHCWVENGHIRMELLYSKMSARGKALADMLAAAGRSVDALNEIAKVYVAGVNAFEGK